MKRIIPILLSSVKTSFRRRKMLSALVAGILFIVGLPGISMASGDKHADNFDTYSVTVIKDYSVAGSGTPDIIKVTVNPTPPVGTQLTFIISGSSYNPVLGTDASGSVTLSFSSGTVGPVTVDIYNGGTLVNSLIVHFIATPGPPSAATSYLTVVQNPAADDGVAQDSVDAYVYDANGNKVADGSTVTFTIMSGTAVIHTTGVTVNGVARAAFTSTVAGSVQVQGALFNGTLLTDQANPSNNYVTIQFIVGPVDPSKSYVVVTQNNATADGVAQDIVTVVLKDATGNTITTASDIAKITYSIQSGTATLSGGGNGSSAADYSSTVAGSAQVQAFYNGVALMDQANPSNNYVTINFVAGTVDPSKSYVVVTKSPVTADGTSQDIVTVVLKDANGNTVTNAADIAKVSYSIQSGTATLTGGGNGTLAADYSSTVAGSVQVQAFYNGIALMDQANPTNNYVTIQFVAGVPDPAKSYVVVTKSPVAADGTSQDIVTVVLNDANGNLVTDPSYNANVTYSIQSGTATIVSGTGNGYLTADYTSTVVGSVQVQAFYNGIALMDQANPTNNYVTIQFINGPVDPSKSYVYVYQNPATDDGVAQDIVKVVLMDAYGHDVTAANVGNVTYSILSGTATGVSGTGNGTASAAYVSTTAGYVKVQAFYNGVALNDQANPTNNYVTIQFVTGTPVPGDPGGGGGTPGGSDPGGGGPTAPGATGYTVEFVVLDHRLANGVQKDSVAAYVTDASKQPVKGAIIQFALLTSPTAGTASSTAVLIGDPLTGLNVASNSAGFCGISITNTTPGTVFISATLNGVAIDNSYRVVTFEDAPDTNNAETYIKTVIYEALADGSSQTQVKVHVVSLSGDVVSGQEVKFTIDSGIATIVTPGPYILDANGEVYINLVSKTPGNVSISATVDDMHIKNGDPARVKFAMINIYVPKVFTPNGDGTNDVLKPILVGIQTFHYFSVYNRWGNLVFTTQDANRGWDGTFNGVPQPVESYLWIAEGIDVDGKKIVQKGIVSLVK